VQVQLTSPSGVAGTQGTPCDVPISYVSVGHGGRAWLCSSLGPARWCPSTRGGNMRGGRLVPVQLASPSAVPTTYAKRGEAKEGAGSSQDTWRRLTATSWNGTSGVAPPGVLSATYRYRTSGTRASGCGPGGRALLCSFLGPARPCSSTREEISGGRLVPVQLTSPGGVAGTQGTPGPRSRDGLPDRDDVPGNVRLVPAEWVRPWVPCLAMLVSWSCTVVPFKSTGEYVEAA
jgi:hypothetical protein